VGLRLFEHPLSPYARKVKLLLYEKGIPFERVSIDVLRRGTDRSYQEFVLASPRLEVPALVDGRTRIHDSRILADYLEERWPDPPLLPASPEERARVRMLETLCDTRLDAVVWGLMEVVVFRRVTGELAEVLLDRSRTALERLWTSLDHELEERPFINGEQFGRGDAAALPHMGGPPGLGIPLPERFERLHAWLARCGERESVRREAGEVAEAMGAMGAGVDAAEPIVRTYRDHRLEWMLRCGAADVVLAGLRDGTIRLSEE
jgi:glutathione S-transferase/RNA polymerase-associated protein